MIISAIPCKDAGETRKKAEDNLAKYGWRIVYNDEWFDGIRMINGVPCYDIVKGG